MERSEEIIHPPTPRCALRYAFRHVFAPVIILLPQERG